MARALFTGVATAGGVVLGSAGAYAAIVRPKSSVFLANAHLMGCALHCIVARLIRLLRRLVRCEGRVSV